ncbi:PilW family protein [Pseudoalteromonas tunicata]|uniref:Type IV pilus assembly protein PilW n=1 Tax=Pseudoalteromonas tunicata D2 TaxID=87626 RepID=A4C622_9GAMM|nr:PilW family protein [Pseudoalteromonas tunicata]ATC95399.1 type IV pilus assembly protein PilW [Pseudoalteromonas tunicata]AXT30980.1 prepilin-type N-terminal cleavage/methylation domain-containing protein [Pseudoalteromonas tunicata]EAR29426.1 hypothetical protein PTD2_11439 [Pseudoalteromonas tunicata D2]
MKQRGFTIVELMISLFVGAFILAGVMFTYVAMKTTTKDTLEIGDLQESGRLAMDILRRDIELAGFWGTFSQSPNEANVLAPALPSPDCSAGENNASFPVASSSNFRFVYGEQTNGANVLGCISDSISNSDVIQLKGVAGNDSTGQSTGTNQYYFVVNPNSISVISGTGAVVAIPPGSSLWAYNHHAYYIANDSYTVNGRSLTVPTLMRKRLTAKGITTETIMEGVENIRFLYGMDFNGDNRVDTYKTVSQMSASDWEQQSGVILTVQMFILVRSMDIDRDMKSESRTYTLGGSGQNARDLTFNDQYRRMLFVSTVRLDNGGNDRWQW